jgi:hypothetical protein
MNTPLTEQQRELLSAWLDGEVTDAERETVETLLQREESAKYVESLRATAALVAAHAPVRAPVGLSGRVLNALEGEFKPRAAGAGSEPVAGIPTLSWRAPLYAAAAAILVALAIMFGPALTSPGTPPSVARTPLENLPERTALDATADEDGKLFDLDEEPAGPASDSAGVERTEEGERDHPNKAAVEKLGKESGEKLKNEQEKNYRANRSGAPQPPDSAAGKPDGQMDEGDNVERERAGEEEAGAGGGKQPGARKGESRGDGDAADTKKDKVSEPRPVLGKATDKEEAKEAADDQVTIDISDARSIAAQTDVLWVSSLYGDAEVNDENVDVESIAVEIDPAKLPELMAALRRLAKDQGYGEVDGDAEETQLFDRDRESGRRISGYLPADEAETPPPEAAKPAPQPEEAAPAGKVRIVIRLK